MTTVNLPIQPLYLYSNLHLLNSWSKALICTLCKTNVY